MKEFSDRSWSCLSCEAAIDTFSHAKWCAANSDLREGLDLDNDKDLVRYISNVLLRRENKTDLICESKRKTILRISMQR